MNNIIVGISKKEDIINFDNKSIYGYVFNLLDYGVYYSLDLSIDEILNLKTEKNLYVCINKMLFNKDIDYITKILKKLDSKNISVIFEDLAILNIVNVLNLNIELIYNQIHFATNYVTVNYLQTKNCSNVVLSTEITLEDIKKIKKNSSSKLFGYCYGRVPMLYSKRSLLSNYFSYIDCKKENNKYYIKTEKDLNFHLIEEKNDETIIYTDVINLGKYSDVFDYVILNNPSEVIIDSYINNDFFDENYNYLFKKSIYKVK